jgi:hypothetical protein
VDVVVPCYQYGRFLRECVTSVLAQDGVDVRVLIIDDCSSDETEAVGRDLAAGSPRVEYRRHPANRGHVATFNEGVLGWARSDYTLLLSADDLLIPGALRRVAGLLDAHPRIGMAYGRDVVLRPGDPLGPPDDPACPPSSASHMLPSGIGPAPTGGTRVLSSEEFLSLASACCDNPVPSPTAVVRTRTQQAIGGYRAELPHAGDMEMWMRFAAAGPVGFVDARQAYYRRHGTNMHTRYAGTGCLDDLRQRLAAFRAAMASCRLPLPDREALMTRAARCIAEAALARAQDAFHDGNLEFCEQSLAYALATSPDVRSAAGYSRLVWKRRLGRKAWSVVQPGWGLVRRLRRPAAQLTGAQET